VIVVNYQEKPVGPLLFFLLFVLVCLIGLPLWYFTRFGFHIPAHTPRAGSLIIAPVLGILYLIMIARTFAFNARVRRDPRALQWDRGSLSLWQGSRAETLPWRQVGEVSIKRGRKPSDLSFLKIVTSKPGAGVMRWSFPSGRLRLAGQSLADIASQLEQARAGNPIPPTRTPADRQEAVQRYNERLATARGIVAIVMSVYFVTLFGMIIYLSSSNTMLLTPHDPLLWLAAKSTFITVAGAWFVWYVKTVWNTPRIAWRVVVWFFPKVMIPGAFFGAMMGGWAYLAANVYVTAKTWGGHVEQGKVLMVAELWVSHYGRPTIHAHLINRPGQDVFFTIDEADAKLLQHWHDPGYIDEPACVTVPVQWAGYAIRAEANSDTSLPKGSISTCS
jgi:hypothetical protein